MAGRRLRQSDRALGTTPPDPFQLTLDVTPPSSPRRRTAVRNVLGPPWAHPQHRASTRKTASSSFPRKRTAVRNKFVPRHRRRCDARLDGCRVQPRLKNDGSPLSSRPGPQLSIVILPGVIPAKAGIQCLWMSVKAKALDSRFRGNDAGVVGRVWFQKRSGQQCAQAGMTLKGCAFAGMTRTELRGNDDLEVSPIPRLRRNARPATRRSWRGLVRDRRVG